MCGAIRTMIPLAFRRWLGLPGPEADTAPVQPERERPPNPAWNHDLAMAVLAGRDDVEPYARYADWLLENNDPRGALIQGDEAVLERHAAHFLGPLQYEQGIETDWQLGFWHRLRIEREWDADRLPELLRQALAHPSALVLHRLELTADCIPELVEVLTDGPTLPIRELVVDARGGLLGSWAAVWPRLPHLRLLSLSGMSPALGDIDLPELRRLAIDADLTAEAQWSVGRMATPKLDALELTHALDADVAAQVAQRFPGLS